MGLRSRKRNGIIIREIEYIGKMILINYRHYDYWFIKKYKENIFKYYYLEADIMDLFENLSKEQEVAVKTIDEDLEIIACAGAGKTGVVTRRIINILKCNNNVLPENIVAFTFTEKAAKELKSRIYNYGEAVLGNTKGFANMYVGTIHGFCLKMLQEHIVQFQKFTVLDEIKTKLFIEKNYNFCGMKDLDVKIYAETNLF